MRPKKIGPTKTLFLSRSGFSSVRAAHLDFGAHGTVTWDYPEIIDSLCILPIDDKGIVHLVSEWRLAWRAEVLQIPGGVCPGMTEAGRRRQARHELQEEVGMDAKKLTKLATLQLSPRIKGTVHMYLATGLFPSSRTPDDHEFLKIVKMPFPKAHRLFSNGKRAVGIETLLALTLAKQRWVGQRKAL